MNSTEIFLLPQQARIFCSDNQTLISRFGEGPLILLTKLDKQKVLVLIDNIKYVEATPDTLIRFINGDMLIVSESLEEISELVLQFKSRCLTSANSSKLDLSSSALGDHASWT